MLFRQSNSTGSKHRTSWFDPTRSLLPVFLGVLRAATLAPFVAMFLGSQFGLSAGLDAPSAWPLAALGAFAFWITWLLPRYVRNSILLNICFVALGILGWIGWMAIEPDWPIGQVLRDPASIVGGNGHFVWTFLLTFIFWIFTLRLALDARERSSDGVRAMLVRSLVAILAGTILAAVIGGKMGDEGIHAAFLALPATLIAGIGAVGISEMGETRETARRRGTTMPGWGRWLRTFGGSSALLLIIVAIAMIALGPGFISLLLDALRVTWSMIATVLLWVMYGVVYALVYIYRGIAWILGHFFDVSMKPIEPPEMNSQQGTPTPLEPSPPGESDFPAAELLRFGVIGAVVLIGLAVLLRFTATMRKDSDGEIDEERASVFSGSLLRNQLRNMFRHRLAVERPRKLNLESDPASVRESMLYLQVLAERLGHGRKSLETSHDFTSRLAKIWPNLAIPLAGMNDRYENVRYGESEEDRATALRAWREIRDAQRETLRQSSTRSP